MIAGLFYQQYHFANTCSQWRSKTRNVFFFGDDRIVCVAGRAWAIRVDSGGIFIVSSFDYLEL